MRMESLLQSLLHVCESSSEVSSSLLRALGSASSRSILAGASDQQLDAALDAALQAQVAHTHISIAAAYFLDERAKSRPPSSEQEQKLFIKRTSNFFLKCNDKPFVLCPEIVVSIVRVYRLPFSVPLSCVLVPLLKALRRLQNGNIHLLTPLHAIYTRICLKEQLVLNALELINTPVFDVFKGLQAIENLEYHYYSGVILLCLKHFEAAMACLQQVLAAPSHQLSAIQVSAFQKLCLCSLVLYGSVRPLPSFVGSIVYKEVQKASAPYSVLCRPDCSLSFLQAFVQEHAELLKKDGNFGLAEQAVMGVLQSDICSLASTYIALPLQKVALSTGMEDVESCKRLILQMIMRNQLRARIDESTQVLILSEDEDDDDEEEVLRQLQERVKIGIACCKRAKVLEKTFAFDVAMARCKSEAQGQGGDMIMFPSSISEQ